ncbi:MAG TPA: hypothetical protein VFE11_06830, partial [Dongiaceae bacterium]|nr:hypothetical protein [Dongiaceae bacterium]
MRRALYIGIAIVGILLALVAGLFGVLQTGFARDQMRHWIASATAGTSTQVQLAAIEGLVPFDMTFAGLRLSDRDGTWLTADRISMAWSPGALLSGRLQVDEIAAGAIDMLRTPAPARTQEPTEPGPLIPELPIGIDLRRLSVERLALAAAILGEPAALSVMAHARLGDVGDGLSASLSLRQLSGRTGTAQVDLAYQPEQDTLSLNGKVEEPQGGVLGRLLGLRQGSDLRVAMAGEGPLADWRGRMSATLDSQALLDLNADIEGRESHTVDFALHVAPDALLPDQVRPLVGGGVNAKGKITIPPAARSIGVSAFSLQSAAGELSASGVLGLHEPGDLAVTLALADSKPFAALVPDVAWSAAGMQARLQGTVDAPHVTGDLTVQNLAAADMRVGAGKLALDADAGQGLDHPIGIHADLSLSDLASPDTRLTALLSQGVQFALAGSVDRAGTIAADKLDLRAGALTLAGSGQAEKWGAAGRKADIALAIADIAAIATPMGVPAKGAAKISLKLEPGAQGDRLEVNGTTDALSLGQRILDRLLGPSPNLHLALEGTVPQTITITTAQFAGAKARLDAQGGIADRKLDLKFTGLLDDLRAIDPAISGKVTMAGAVQGTFDAPSAAVTLASPAIGLAGHSAQNLNVSTTATDLLTKPQIQLDGTASLDKLPARVAASVSVEGERIAAQKLALALGKSRITGDVAMVKSLLSGKLMLDAPDLAEIAPLAGTDMSGALSAALALDGAKNQQSAQLTASGHNISATDTLKIEGLDLKA